MCACSIGDKQALSTACFSARQLIRRYLHSFDFLLTSPRLLFSVSAILVVNNKHRCLLGSGEENGAISFFLSVLLFLFSSSSPWLPLKPVNNNNKNNNKEGRLGSGGNRNRDGKTTNTNRGRAESWERNRGRQKKATIRQEEREKGKNGRLNKTIMWRVRDKVDGRRAYQ